MILFTDSRTGNKVYVTIRVPEQKFEGSKDLTASVPENSFFDLRLNILLNAEFSPKNKKYKTVIPDLRLWNDSDYIWHLTGTPVKKKTIRLPIYIYGKKFTIRIKVKK